MAWYADKLIAAVGGDYTTLAAFEAAYDGENISATDGVRARIKGTTSDSGDIAFASWQAGQSVSCKIVITAETGYGLQDRVGWTGADGSGDDAIIPQVLRFAEPTNPLYIDIYNLEVIKRIQWYQCIGGVIRVWNGLVRDTAANLIYFTANCGTTTAYLANLLARDLGLGYGAVTCSDADVTVYAWHITHDVSGYGYYCDAGAMQLRNSIGVNVTNGAINANVTDNDYCAADDTTPDNSGIDNIVEADNFTDIVGEDYTVKDTGADIYHAGTDQPAWFDALTGGKDIRGVAWHTTTPSMGCFEYEEAGGNVEVTPPKGSLILTGKVPIATATANVEITTPKGALGLTGYAPTVTVSDHKNVTVPLAALSLTGKVPTVGVTDNIEITTPKGTLSLTGKIPIVNITGDQAITVPSGALLLSGKLPTVSATAHQWIDPPCGSLALTGKIPTVETSDDKNVTIPAGALSLTGKTPTATASADVFITVPKGSLTLTGKIPTIATTADINITIPKGSLVLTGKTPVVSGSGAINITVPIGALILTGKIPDLKGYLISWNSTCDPVRISGADHRALILHGSDGSALRLTGKDRKALRLAGE